MSQGSVGMRDSPAPAPPLPLSPLVLEGPLASTNFYLRTNRHWWAARGNPNIRPTSPASHSNL